MAFYTGCNGSVVYNLKPVAKVRDWSLETTVTLLETTTMGSCINTYITGNKSATGSATLMYYRLETGESTNFTEFTALLSNIHKIGDVSKTPVQLTLKVGTGTNDDIIANVFITSASISVGTGELVTVPIQFTVDGDFLAGGVITA
jgi:hypothetical protein